MNTGTETSVSCSDSISQKLTSAAVLGQSDKLQHRIPSVHVFTAMSRRNCAVGTKWDNLLKTCMPLKIILGHPPPTEPALIAVLPLKNTTPAAQMARLTMFNPGLWIFVLLATLGSILALALWIVIYIRHKRPPTVEAEPAEQPPQKIDPPSTVHSLLPSEKPERAERAGAPHSQCPHLHTGIQTSSTWEEGFGAWRVHIKHDGKDWAGGPVWSAVRQETVPLPATELGGTALVTTKTV